jgi:hypothetical protein
LNFLEDEMKVYLRSTVAIAVLAMCLALAGTAAAKGKKFGLFVGINKYPEPTNTLYGAVNDAKNMKALLESPRFGFMAANDVILTDQQATRAAILSNLTALGAKAGAGDLLVFQYSGHGTLFPDKYSDEVDEAQKTELHVVFEDGSKLDIPSDYYDSAICPWDLDSESSGKNWGNLILDDELYDAFAPLTARGVQVVFIADSCHSGSVAKAGKLGGQVRFANPFALRKVNSFADMKLTAPAGQQKIRARQLPGNYLALTAAKDNEFAMDSSGAKIPSGLFTTTLIDTINANNSTKAPLTYARLIGLTTGKVATVSLTMNNNQHPQLDSRFGNPSATIFSIPLK